MPSFSLDFLYNLTQITEISTFSNAEILEKGKLFYLTLKELLVDVNRRCENCVIEGEVILPEFIAELSKKYDIKCCFLGISKTSLDVIIEHGGYFNWPQWKLENGSKYEVQDLAVHTANRSMIIQSEAKKHNLPYYDLANNYHQTFQAALQNLLK